MQYLNNNHPPERSGQAVPSGHPSFAGGELPRSGFVLQATSKPDRSSSSPPEKGEYREAGRGVSGKLMDYHFLN